MSAAQSQDQHAANVLRWVHAPQQARTREGLARLLEAAEQLISAKGFEEASIAEIAQLAGTSVGGFYRRFRDKDGVIQALHERFCDEARITADDALAPSRWTGEPLDTVMREFAAFLVQIYRDREGLLRAFLARAHWDEPMRARTRLLSDHLTERLSALLRARRDELRPSDPKLAAAFGLQIVLGTLNCAVLLPPQPVALRDDELPHELAHALSSYLGVRAAKPTLQISRSKRRRP